ncbi:MAG: hypothetical protein ACRD4O_02380 [Bryobacteraceae bacterium]
MKRFRWTISFDRIAGNPPVLAFVVYLPGDVQLDAKRAYRLFQTNPAHPSLRFKKLEGEDTVYSARIGLGYRALAAVKQGRAVWFWNWQP